MGRAIHCFVHQLQAKHFCKIEKFANNTARKWLSPAASLPAAKEGGWWVGQGVHVTDCASFRSTWKMNMAWRDTSTPPSAPDKLVFYAEDISHFCMEEASIKPPSPLPHLPLPSELVQPRSKVCHQREISPLGQMPGTLF